MRTAGRLKRKLVAWVVHRLGSCKKAACLISRSLDRNLSVRERIVLAVHVKLCSHCGQYREHLEIMRKIAQTSAEDVEAPTHNSSASLSPEARERIKKALRDSINDDIDRQERDAG